MCGGLTQELQRVNAEQLLAIRALEDEGEAKAAERIEQMQASHEEELAGVQARLDKNEQHLAHLQVCMLPPPSAAALNSLRVL